VFVFVAAATTMTTTLLLVPARSQQQLLPPAGAQADVLDAIIGDRRRSRKLPVLHDGAGGCCCGRAEMLLKQHLRDTSNQQHATSCSTCSVTVVLASRGWNGLKTSS
jgi:hypothetical protein